MVSPSAGMIRRSGGYAGFVGLVAEYAAGGLTVVDSVRTYRIAIR